MVTTSPLFDEQSSKIIIWQLDDAERYPLTPKKKKLGVTWAYYKYSLFQNLTWITDENASFLMWLAAMIQFLIEILMK